MTWPLQYRIDRIPPASSSAISILPTNIVFLNSASSGNTLRVDSKRQRTSPSGSVVVSESRAAFCANRATRPAASVPASVIHCIIRPPWIWPGAPACSGNTHWTISTTESAIDGIRALYHLVPPARRPPRRRRERVRVTASERRLCRRNRSWGEVSEGGRSPPPSVLAPAARGSFDRDGVEVVEAGRLQAQPTHAFP